MIAPAWIDAFGQGWSAHVPDLALAAALAWGAGLRLYFVMFLFGAAAYFGYWQLPTHLAFLAHPLVLAAAGFMMVVELFADKLPFLDTIWDAIHTFIRIPAGAALAAGVFGDSGAAVAAAAAILGGGLTATTHFSKAGARAAANTSPEPFTNAILSTVEDVVVFVGSLVAVHAPVVFLVLIAVFLLAALVLLRWLIRGARRLADRSGRAAGAGAAGPGAVGPGAVGPTPAPPGIPR